MENREKENDIVEPVKNTNEQEDELANKIDDLLDKKVVTIAKYISEWEEHNKQWKQHLEMWESHNKAWDEHNIQWEWKLQQPEFANVPIEKLADTDAIQEITKIKETSLREKIKTAVMIGLIAIDIIIITIIIAYINIGQSGMNDEDMYYTNEASSNTNITEMEDTASE